VAFLAATADLDLRAVVSFYGGGIGAPGEAGAISRAAGVSCPIQFVFGQDDPLIPEDHVEAIRAGLTAENKDFEIATFEGATHGFACDGRAATFHAVATEQAWSLTERFLATHLT
jgi:carboxymethylenebutenolidase